LGHHSSSSGLTGNFIPYIASSASLSLWIIHDTEEEDDDDEGEQGSGFCKVALGQGYSTPVYKDDLQGTMMTIAK